MLQRLQTTLKKGLLLFFLALGLPQVGKADSLQVKKDVFLIDVSRSMQGHGSVSTPNGADQAAPCGAVITTDRRRKKKVITSSDIDAFANASAKKWMEDLRRDRPDWGSFDDAREEADRRIKAAEERKKTIETPKPQRQQQAGGSNNTNNQSTQPSQAGQDRPLSSYTDEELYGKNGQKYLDEDRYLTAKVNGDVKNAPSHQEGSTPRESKTGTKKLSSNPTRAELREYWNNTLRTSQRQIAPVAERVAKNAEAMKMSQEAYKRRLQEERAFVVAGVVGVLLVVGVLVLGAFKREAPVKEEQEE